MLLSVLLVFSLRSYASQPDMSDLVSPATDDGVYSCHIKSSSSDSAGKKLVQAIPWTKADEPSLSDCASLFIPSMNAWYSESVSSVRKSGRDYIFCGDECYYGTTSFIGISYDPNAEKEYCPNPDFPEHTISVETNTGLRCAKLLRDFDREKKECENAAGSRADDWSWNSDPSQGFSGSNHPNCVTVRNSDGFESKCAITGADDWIDVTPSGSSRNTFSPLGGSINGNTCDASGNENEQGRHCVASDNGTLKSVSCPDGSSMSVDLGEIQAAISDRYQANRESIEQLENNIVTYAKLQERIANDADFKASISGADGEKGEKGDDGSDGINGSNGINGLNGVDGIDGKDGATGEQGIQGLSGVDGSAGRDGIDGMDGAVGDKGEKGDDGESCNVVYQNLKAIITCKESSAEINDIDKDGIIEAIDTQTQQVKSIGDTLDEINSNLNQEIGTGKADFSTERLTEVIGEANDWETRNFGTVVENSVSKIKQTEIFKATDGFFDVDFTGTCPVYTANIPLFDAPVVIDHFCTESMANMLAIIKAIIILGFSFAAFRVAIL